MQKTQLEKRACDFLKTRKTLLMATLGVDEIPTASYAPFVRENGNFYVYISALSRHTRDLLQKSAVSVLLIEDEADAKNIFARRRITFSCEAYTVPKKGAGWWNTIGIFEKTFGQIFDILKSLPDFVLFRLEPSEATYVEGFGKAYRMDKHLRNPVHVKGTGPSPRSAGEAPRQQKH